MTPSQTSSYCAPPEVIRLLARDGLGWGHDLDCGTFQAAAPAQKPEEK